MKYKNSFKKKLLDKLEISSRLIKDDKIMYNTSTSIDDYDIRKIISEKLDSTLSGPTDYNCLKYLEKKRTIRILDLGRGAGAFFLAAKSVNPNIQYVGIDLSESQISRAKELFDAKFIIGEISELSVDYLKDFDLIHIYSVLNFMPISKQKKLLSNLVDSGVPFFTDFICSLPTFRGVFENQLFNVSDYDKNNNSVNKFLSMQTCFYPERNEVLSENYSGGVVSKNLKLVNKFFTSSPTDFINGASMQIIKDPLYIRVLRKLVELTFNAGERVYLFPRDQKNFNYQLSRKYIFEKILPSLNTKLIKK